MRDSSGVSQTSPHRWSVAKWERKQSAGAWTKIGLPEAKYSPSFPGAEVRINSGYLVAKAKGKSKISASH
jgi:hypothetical protein